MTGVQTCALPIFVDTHPEVFLRDSGSGHVWGPFASGQKVKYTQAASGPSAKQLGGSDILHLTGTGDAALYAVDFSGNASAPVACLVPAPPKQSPHPVIGPVTTSWPAR